MTPAPAADPTDASPALDRLAADTALLASRSDAALLVLDARRSRGRQAVRAIELLHDAGAVPLGAVLNRLPKRSMHYGYAGYERSAPEHAAQPAASALEPRA